MEVDGLFWGPMCWRLSLCLNPVVVAENFDHQQQHLVKARPVECLLGIWIQSWAVPLLPNPMSGSSLSKRKKVVSENSHLSLRLALT